MKQSSNIIFLNPRAAQVFQDMAYDAAKCWTPSLIWTEVSGVVHFYSNDDLIVKQIPRWACYNRKNYLTRIVSMLIYFFYVFTKVLFNSPKSVLFMVTPPPFLGLIGYVFKKIRRQRYIMLVYDNLSGALIGAGLMKESLITKIWRKFNRLVLNNADAVITIGEYMTEKLNGDFDVSRIPSGQIDIIHNWADVESIKPILKEHNPFLNNYDLQGKFVVMYSGNIGATHDIETLIEASQKLKCNPDIQFVIIGEGAKKQYILDQKEK